MNASAPATSGGRSGPLRRGPHARGHVAIPLESVVLDPSVVASRDGGASAPFVNVELQQPLESLVIDFDRNEADHLHVTVHARRAKATVAPFVPDATLAGANPR